MIGTETGKIVAYSIRNKSCKVCEIAENGDQVPSSHDCKRNWSGKFIITQTTQNITSIKYFPWKLFSFVYH